jgi:DNA-directed RNA polymerase specialized sigma24 family protein
MVGPADDWREALDRLLSGDRRAFVALNRLITTVLTQLRAYDLREEWDDVRRVVLASLIANARAGHLRDGPAIAGYVRILTRQRMVEELKASLRAPAAAAVSVDVETPHEVDAGVWSAVDDLTADQRQVIEDVYREGKSYQAVSEVSGVPIAAMKRRLRAAFSSLRRRLGGPAGIGG